jgi:hypothetical protein
MHCTVSCWILGEYGDREWVSNGELIWLKHEVYRSEVLRRTHLDYQYTVLKNEGQEGKRDLFWG